MYKPRFLKFIYLFIHSLSFTYYFNIFLLILILANVEQIKTGIKKICNKMDFGSLLKWNTLNLKGLQKHSVNKVFTGWKI